MATRGYRVYTFRLFAGNEQLSLELEAHRERLLEVLGLVGAKTRVGSPRRQAADGELEDKDPIEYLEGEEYEKTQPTLTVRGSAYDKDLAIIHSSIALGEQGLHDYAVNPDDGADRVDVTTRSAETPRRTDFYFASTGFEGFLVTEAVGMRDPVPLLVKWVRRVSLDQRNQELSEIDKEYKSPKPPEGRIAKYKAREAAAKTLRISVERVADPDLLEKILDDIQSMDAVYTELDENNKETDKRLVVKVREKGSQRKIADLLTGGSGAESIIRQSLEELDIDSEGLHAANIDPQDVKAHIHSSDGNATLVPGKISDLFNYRFGSSGKPRDTPYYETTLKKVSQLKGPAQIPLGEPETFEVVEWIQREEEAWLQEETLVDE